MHTRLAFVKPGFDRSAPTCQFDEHRAEFRFGEVRCGITILGNSSPLRRMLDAVELVAPTNATVLILGETGVGKELVARTIHQLSPRRDHPMVTVNCSAIPAELFESEFFGHVRGAFSGALRDRIGRFQLADGGTLFLDEIGDLPASMQPKLLRVLQQGEFDAVGGETPRRADVRVIAATNRDLGTQNPRGTVPRRPLFIGSAYFRSKCRRCAIARMTSHCLRNILLMMLAGGSNAPD